jgi:meso-butanediol dehydrogenase/(S,S)-butanediol dehydrogenase/diacetyl reductase
MADSRQFASRRVLVTGSTRGIGRATAELFLAKGADVILHGRNTDDIARVAARLGNSDRVTGYVADLSRRSETMRLAEEVGEVDVLVNCAGIYIEKSIADSDEAFFVHSLEINLTAGFLLARSLLPALRDRRGVIVNVSSDAGLLGYSGSAVYSASKGAVIGLTKALAVELAPAVRALCVCPGSVATDMMENAVKATSDPEAARRQWASYSMLGRVGEPREIAEAIVFAASPAASFATGSIIAIDGGATAGKRV